MKKILLFLDAELRSTLAMVRSIGELTEYKIITAGRKKYDIVRFSKFSQGFYLYEDPVKSKTAFIKSFKRIIKRVKPDFIISGSDLTLLPIYTSEIYDLYRNILIIPDRETYFRTFDKKEMNYLAKFLNIKVIEEIDKNEINNSSFPFIIKPRQSRYYVNDKMEPGFRKFVFNFEEFNKTLIEISKYDSDPLIQKIINGKGFGVFIAAKEGDIFASFAHERIREVPLKGGVSTMRKSIEINNHLLEYSREIIKVLKWTGIAMIEFKGETGKEAYFMEINGRPWGSLDLAVSSGMDFPKMLIDLYINQLSLDQLISKHNNKYQLDYYSKWIIGEIKYLINVLLSDLPIKRKVNLSLNLLFDRPKKISYDTLKWYDPLPFFMEIIGVLNLRKIFKNI